MSDPTLAAEVVKSIQPYLGTLLGAGVGAAGKDMWQGVKDIWAHLGPKMAENADLKSAAQTVVERPADPVGIDLFRIAVQGALDRDRHFAEAIAPHFKDLPARKVVSAGGDAYVGNSIDHSDNSQIGRRDTLR